MVSTPRETVVISGGTGSAKFLRGLQRLGHFTVVANVGDNCWFHGLYVCPDVDIVMYTLAGVADYKRGWGIQGDEFKALAVLKRLGAPGTWFNIGDMDLATDVFRTSLMKDGMTLTEITAKVARGLGVRERVLPATDQHVETRIETEESGEMHLQEFWVKEGGQLTPKSVRYVGARQAKPTKEVARSLSAAGRVIIAPANPITSILPTLSIGGMKQAISKSRARKVAISPMVGSRAYSGPATKMMEACGLKASSEGLADIYKGLIDVLIIDESDRSLVGPIETRGISCITAPTLMRTVEDAQRLAKLAMDA